MVSLALLSVLFALSFRGLPPLGDYRGQYGPFINALVVPERHVTDAVTAINFDIRGFDTLGEEFIFFSSVMGVVLLMRRQSDEETGDHEDHTTDRKIPRSSDAMRLLTALLVPPTLLFGIYMVTHGQLTPGGGFQGGVVSATAAVLIYLGSRFGSLHRVIPRRLLEVSEAFGAGGYALVGLGCVALGGVFLENNLPLGEKGSLFSGGIMPLISAAVGLEVCAGFLILLATYLEELLEAKEQ